jgi:hypothetical protein
MSKTRLHGPAKQSAGGWVVGQGAARGARIKAFKTAGGKRRRGRLPYKSAVSPLLSKANLAG